MQKKDEKMYRKHNRKKKYSTSKPFRLSGAAGPLQTRQQKMFTLKERKKTPNGCETWRRPNVEEEEEEEFGTTMATLVIEYLVILRLAMVPTLRKS